MRKKFLITWMVLVTIVLYVNLMSPNLQELVRRVNPSVVKIESVDEYGQKWSGSGVIVHEHGLILTAKHVIEDANDIEVILADGRRFEVIDKIVDPNNDVGIVRIAPLEDLPAVEFGGDVQVGQDVFIIGSPYGIFNSVSRGIVSKTELIELYFGSDEMILLDIARNPGNSGCPVFDFNGNVVGILVGGITYADGIAYITHRDVCERLLNERKKASQQNDN